MKIDINLIYSLIVDQFLLQYFIRKFLTSYIHLNLHSNPDKLRIMSSIKKKISKFDMFPASPILRAEGETEVVNLCGSIFSILVFMAFVYIFAAATANTVNLQNIKAVENIQMNRKQEDKIQNITMAVGLQWMNLTLYQNIFQVRAFSVRNNFDFTELKVFPCNREFWKDLDDINYKSIGLSGSMCIQKQRAQIFGWFGTPDVKMIYMNVSQCSNTTSPIPCAPQASIDYFFDNYMIWGRLFSCSLYILDARINPNEQNALSYTIFQKTVWLLFNKNQFTMLQLFFGTYEINTDISFLPWEVQDSQTGYYVTQSFSIDYVNNNFTLPLFAQFFIFSSPANKTITRSYGKIDDALSYVGGLFGIIMSFFSFFLLSFNEYKYELRVSEGAFSFKDRSLAKQSDFHFLKFLKYVTYDWIKTFTCYEPDWDDCRAINEAREQAIQQIDIKHLLQRISHIEKINNTLVSQQKETLLYLSQSHSIEHAKRKRRIVDYCNKFSSLDKSMTIRDYEQAAYLYNFAISNSSIHPQNNLNESDQFEESFLVNKSSLEIMDQYIEKYKDNMRFEQNNFNINEEQLEIEKQIAKSFFNSKQSDRIKSIKNIPLGILYRLSSYRNHNQAQDLKKNKQLMKSGQLKPLKNTGRVKKRKVELQNFESTLQFKN